MIIVIILFVLLLVLGMPIGFVLAIPSLLYVIVNNIPTTVIVQRMTQSLNSFPLLAIPLFIIAGRLMNEGGVTKRIFRFAKNTVGFIPGGLGHVNIITSMIFAGMSGVAIADIGGLGQIEIKAMNDANYPIKFTAGITATSAIVGPIIPPSIPISIMKGLILDLFPKIFTLKIVSIYTLKISPVIITPVRIAQLPTKI